MQSDLQSIASLGFLIRVLNRSLILLDITIRQKNKNKNDNYERNYNLLDNNLLIVYRLKLCLQFIKTISIAMQYRIV